VKNLADSASFHSREKTAPSNPGIKHLVDEAEAKLFDQACNDDGPAGVTSRLALLRAHRPSIYSRGLALRHEMMQLAIEEKRRTLEAPTLIDGQVTTTNGIRADFVGIISMPWNRRDHPPHCPQYNPRDGEGEGEPEIVPVPQDGSGLDLGTFAPPRKEGPSGAASGRKAPAKADDVRGREVGCAGSTEEADEQDGPARGGDAGGKRRGRWRWL
jgi:hypothetical protein